jgi:hypothetical protein
MCHNATMIACAVAMIAFFLPIRRASRQNLAAIHVFFERDAAHAACTSASVNPRVRVM